MSDRVQSIIDANEYSPKATIRLLSECANDLEQQLSASQAREAELRERLEAAEMMNYLQAQSIDSLSQELEAAEAAVRIASFNLISVKKDPFQAEAKIKASQEQEPVAFAYPASCGTPLLGRAGDGGYGIRSEKAYGDMPGAIALYPQPPIPPELAELQRENADLRKLLEESKVPETREAILLEVETAIADELGPEGYKAFQVIQKLKAQRKEQKE